MLEVGLRLKADNKMRRTHQDILPVRTLLMMFFNPSLRTRNSFEAGIFQLGGHAHFLEPSSSGFSDARGRRPPLPVRAHRRHGPGAVEDGRCNRHSRPWRSC